MFDLNSRFSGFGDRVVLKLSTFVLVIFALGSAVPWLPFEWVTDGERRELIASTENRLELLAAIDAENIAQAAGGTADETATSRQPTDWLQSIPHGDEVHYSTRPIPSQFDGVQNPSQRFKVVPFSRNGQIGAEAEIPSRGLMATASEDEAYVLGAWRRRRDFGFAVLLFRTVAAIAIGLFLFYELRTRERIRSELIRTQHLAQSATRAKTDFLAHMSHELRTPLNAIIGFSEAIKLAIFGPIERRYQEYGEHIHASGAHLLHLVNDVLDVSKLEAGRFELEESEIDLSVLIASTMSLIQPQAGNARVTIQQALAPGLPNVFGDTRRLQQAILNLLSNAVKFTPQGGTVGLAAEEAGDGILIRISDTGVGIPKNQISAALEPFRQVNAPVRSKARGTGLGLPIARDLVELHGGTLTIESEVNRGTVVSISLPAWRILRGDSPLLRPGALTQ